MNDNDRDRPQTPGQQDADKETERRNRENETGQQQGQQFGQTGQSGQSPSGKERGEGFEQEAGQARERSDTTLASDEAARQQDPGGTTGTEGAGKESASGFVGTSGDTSSDYLTKGEESQDFAEQGQGAQETTAGKTDIETGQAKDEGDAELDDGSNR